MHGERFSSIECWSNQLCGGARWSAAGQSCDASCAETGQSCNLAKIQAVNALAANEAGAQLFHTDLHGQYNGRTNNGHAGSNCNGCTGPYNPYGGNYGGSAAPFFYQSTPEGVTPSTCGCQWRGSATCAATKAGANRLCYCS